ncbi:MAG: HAMP domain-containing sensor histidine kinase [Thiotrichaceae bacterium]
MSQQLQISFNSLEEKNEQLEVVNQLKNDFLGIVAHDLKNPLSIIQSVSMDIECCYDDIGKEGIMEYASMIQLSSHQMFELIDNLLEINIIESGKIDLSITLVNIVSLAQSVLNAYRHHAVSKQIQFNLESDSDAIMAYADEHILRQVLDNLISNALKYSPAHKKIFIKISKLHDKILVAKYKDADRYPD